MVWGGFFSIYTVFRRTGTASLLISLREAARKVPNFAQPIILAYGTYASAKISRHSAVAAWLYGVLRKAHWHPSMRIMQDQRSTHLWEYGG